MSSTLCVFINMLTINPNIFRKQHVIFSCPYRINNSLSYSSLSSQINPHKYCSLFLSKYLLYMYRFTKITITSLIQSFFYNICVRAYWENYISISFHIEWDMIVVTVFLSILNQMEFHLVKLYFQFLSHWMGYDRGDSFPFDFLNQMEFHLVQNQKKNCHHDHIPFNLKGTGNIIFQSISGNAPRILRPLDM